MIKRKIRNNPPDYKLLSQVKIVKKYKWDNQYISYEIYLNDKLIGHAEYTIGKKSIDYVSINKSFRRRGLGTYLYNYIEKDQNIKLKPSKALLEQGKLFWENRQQRNPDEESEIFRLDSISQLKRNANYLGDIIANNINSSRFEIYIVGSVLDKNKFNRNSDVDLAVVIYDKRLSNGFNENLTDKFKFIFQNIPFDFGVLDVSVHNNELLPIQKKLKIYENV